LFYLSRENNKEQKDSDSFNGIGIDFVAGSELSLYASNKGIKMKTADYETGFNVNNNGIEFVHFFVSKKKIIIFYGIYIPENFFSNSDLYLPTILKYLFSYSSVGSPISTNSSPFNFFNDGENTYEGVHILTKDNTDFLFTLNKNDNTTQLRNCK
jgi:hypothetical protein